ncbi:MAG: glutaminyl-peptide cyclotransferase [Bacteroidia bacterium]|nr:glutaminyl-peptide cyclotransferase [Bacteroidia bacterium]
MIVNCIKLHIKRLFIAFLALMPLSACAADKGPFKEYKLQVVEQLPHSRSAYTQGLFFHNNELYESSGQYGTSYFAKIDPKTSKELRRLNFDSRYFLEGACVLNNYLYILTWRENKCFVYDINTFKYLGELYNMREGWGLTTDGTHLILTDGSSSVFFMDPMTFELKKSLKVTLNGKSVNYLNELEYIDGKIWANVYCQDYIVIINPDNGVVEGRVDCKGLLPNNLRNSSTDVLNGIAYNPKTKQLLLTGKLWPKMFSVKLVEK